MSNPDSDLHVYLVRDKTWRGSHFHITLERSGHGVGIIDITSGGSTATGVVTNCSFDGAGCYAAQLPGLDAGFLAFLAAAVPAEGDWKNSVSAGGDTAFKAAVMDGLAQFFQAQEAAIKDNWKSKFRDFGLLQ
jgi:hypothetical protein